MAKNVLQFVRAIVTAMPLFAMPAFAQMLFSTEFEGVDPPARLTISTSTNFHINVGGGVATFSRDQLDPKSTTPRNGTTSLTTDFKLFGDFLATIDVKVIDLSGGGDAGLNITYPAGSAGIFVQGPGGQSGLTSLIHWICSSAGCGDGILFSAGVVKRLAVQRAGSTLYLYAETSLEPGFHLFRTATNASLTEPVAFSLFLGEEFNGIHARQVEFDNLTIKAGSFLQLDPSIVDPVPALLNGRALTRLPTATQASNAPFLGDTSKGRSVKGVAADGVAQLLIRIPTPSAGEVVSVTLKNGQCSDPASSECAKDYGLLFDPTNPPADLFGSSTKTTPIVTTAYLTPVGPMAFVAYRAPSEFVRGSAPESRDTSAASRDVILDIRYADGSHKELKIAVIRPPVMLIHGFNTDERSWDTFRPFIEKTDIYSISRLNYGQRLYQVVQGSAGPEYRPGEFDILSTSPELLGESPALSAPLWRQYARYSHFGFSFNSPRVLKLLKRELQDFARGQNPLGFQVAAAQGDIVAHSMGGLIARYMPTLREYYDPENYGIGYIHKMVSIGTPHLGTPQATFILSPAARCARELGARFESLNFAVATVKKKSGQIVEIAGATEEMRGDGNLAEGVRSAALERINMRADPFPIATIAGDATPLLYLLDGIRQPASGMRFACPQDPYAQRHTSLDYPKIFDPIVFDGVTGSNIPVASDGSVPVTSALFKRQGTVSGIGFTHSSGISDIFDRSGRAPYLLNSAVTSATTESLLNTSSESPVFWPKGVRRSP